MQLTLEQSALKSLLSKLIGAVEKRNTIPSLANVALITDGDMLTGKATDLDIEVTGTSPATVTVQGSTTVSAAMLSAIVAKMPAGSLVSMSMADGMLTVKAGRSKYELQTLPIEDFPLMATSEYSHTFTSQAHDLARLFNLTKGAMSTEETRYYLQGVYIHPSQDGNIVAVATDGHRLAKATMPNDVSFPGVIVPRKTVGELVKMLDLGDVVVSVSETKIKFDMGSTVIVSKVIDGTFPDYQRIIPTKNTNVLTASASEMKSAADRVATVADDRSRAVKIAVDGNSAVLSTRGNVGAAEEEVAVSYSGPPLTLGFNSKYLAEVLAQCSGQEVTLHCGASVDDPVLIKPSDDDGVMFLVMGMRV